MRTIPALLVLPLVVVALTGSASADVAQGPKCKCEAPGVPVEGSLTVGLVSGGALLLAASRMRRRPR